MRRLFQAKKQGAGMSLLELLLVVAIIAIISALLIPYVSPMRGAASVQIARQQQAELQTALGSWVAKASSGPGGLAEARDLYAGADILTLLEPYLQESTYAMLEPASGGISSPALKEAGAFLEFTAWELGGSPSVVWVPTQ